MAKSDSSIVAAQLNLILEKLTLHDQEFKFIHQKLDTHDQEFKLLHQEISEIKDQNIFTHQKIDTVVRLLNGQCLRLGVEVENLQKIHPKNSHQPVVV